MGNVLGSSPVLAELYDQVLLCDPQSRAVLLLRHPRIQHVHDAATGADSTMSIVHDFAAQPT